MNEYQKFHQEILINDRPIGVSGLMRVKNEEKFLELSVKSCVDALDELIIVYQECEDATPEIIKKLQAKYPNKIKSFFYNHTIFSHNLSQEDFNRVAALPLDSEHLLSTYYNFTLSKASYRYALKIDGDQIYNSEKLKTFCNAYRATEKVRIGTREKLAAFTLNLLCIINNSVNRICKNYWTPPLNFKKLTATYNSYVIKKITNEKNPVSFIGLNLYKHNGKWSLPLGSYSDGTFPPFNGVYDHLLFQISDQTYYLPAPLYSNHSKYKNCVIERFAYDDTLKTWYGWKPKLLQGGFLWFHVAPLKNQTSKPTRVIPLNLSIPYKLIRKSLNNNLFNYSRFWYKLFWKNHNINKSEKRNWIHLLNQIKKLEND